MKIEPINAFEYTCTPMNRDSCSIRSMVVIIYAQSREEADELLNRHAHQFFDQDINISVRMFGQGGFRQVTDATDTPT